jgi:nicotinic acid mononucleotide adenylyltransferase
MQKKVIWPNKFIHPKVDLVGRRLKKTFESLAHLGYFGEGELEDYRYYENLISDALVGIDRKISAGSLVPIDTAQFPRIVRYPEGRARVAIYIGSFDPFQLTHLAIALRFLASEKSRSDIVIVIPEGVDDSRKPRKTDYSFRFQIEKMQLSSTLEPFVIPLDIGQNAGTIEIVRRFIALHSGMKLELTHLIGSDVLPLAARYIDEDLAIWRAEAAKSGVEYTHRVHVTRRAISGNLTTYLQHIRARNVETILDRHVVGTPSSTNFRNDRAITLVLPTQAMRDKLEILFRYNMNKTWSKSGRMDRTSPWEI